MDFDFVVSFLIGKCMTNLTREKLNQVYKEKEI